jgi:hypothetical protein
MFDTGIVMTVSLYFGITGIGVTMTDPAMAMGKGHAYGHYKHGGRD